MMNNKGQALVSFIMILPIIIIVFAIIIDLGYLSIEKRTVNNNVKDAVTYGLNHIDDNNVSDKINDMLNENIGDGVFDIIVDNSYIRIKATKTYNSIFKFVSNDNYLISVTYSGNIVDKKITINKEG